MAVIWHNLFLVKWIVPEVDKILNAGKPDLRYDVVVGVVLELRIADLRHQ